jgi:hypothetical protein
VSKFGNDPLTGGEMLSGCVADDVVSPPPRSRRYRTDERPAIVVVEVEVLVEVAADAAVVGGIVVGFATVLVLALGSMEVEIVVAVVEDEASVPGAAPALVESGEAIDVSTWLDRCSDDVGSAPTASSVGIWEIVGDTDPVVETPACTVASPESPWPRPTMAIAVPSPTTTSNAKVPIATDVGRRPRWSEDVGVSPGSRLARMASRWPDRASLETCRPRFPATSRSPSRGSSAMVPRR